MNISFFSHKTSFIIIQTVNISGQKISADKTLSVNNLISQHVNDMKLHTLNHRWKHHMYPEKHFTRKPHCL